MELSDKGIPQSISSLHLTAHARWLWARGMSAALGPHRLSSTPAAQNLCSIPCQSAYCPSTHPQSLPTRFTGSLYVCPRHALTACPTQMIRHPLSM